MYGRPKLWKVLLILAVAWFKKEGYLYLHTYVFTATSCCLHATTDGTLSGKILSFNTKSRSLKESPPQKKSVKIWTLYLSDCLPST